ncbi:kinase-regulated stress-responsive transcription factor skn7 [Conoideocrella luteorostrata]|uniref:Transcription factor n=1 Tax=Conoideocrella luteorostrata TaxID=1105319 RepID=A0AAJ0FYK8_9HYPO|nr:kinase-regulated stress-responsive transcription factor skn7 [Conoideocrella luteorostrata]
MSGLEVATTSGSNASEFVRKLFRMLEDPTHQDVARWGKDGDTFVVVEGEKFTRSILPKHFKHSNMSSFIRQLNKYDFHKVKPSSDSESSNPGGNVLEFKHPYFRADSKDGLDNIRRKAPAPRKPQVAEDFTTSQHVSVISEQLTATQQQVQQLQELFAEVSQTNRLLVNEVMTLQKMVNAQKQAQYEMLNHLSQYEAGNGGMLGQSMNSNGGDVDDGVPELRRARELLSSVAPDTVSDRELERLHDIYAAPSESAAMITPVSIPLMHDPMTDLSRYPVYPVGQTVGIDPFHSDHIHKIPFAIPNEGTPSTTLSTETAISAPAPIPNTQAPAPQSTDRSTSLWGPKTPRVFLVEDDPTCAKIGIKFLKSMGCEVEHAQNGADAYTRVSNVGRDHFDLMFMDIIMPRLDGVSATMYIRQHCPSTPIIAMTSNIRPDEVNGYFEHGMNGVLAKPFTKEGMLKSVKTNMSHLLKNPPEHSDASGFMIGHVPYINAPPSLKFEATSPGANNSGWSPSHMNQSNVDQWNGMINGGNQYSMGRSNFPTSEHDSPPEKRQRLNASQANYG